MRSPRVLSLRKARHPKFSVSQYGIVQSVSRPNRLNHTVVKRGRVWLCTCEDSIYRNPVGGCKHARAARLKLRQRAA